MLKKSAAIVWVALIVFGVHLEADEVQKVLITKAPTVADPKTFDYPDCNIALTGKLENGTNIQIIVPAFRNRQMSSTYRQGESVVFFLRPFEQMTEEIQQMPLIDDESAFLLTRYWGERRSQSGNISVVHTGPQHFNYQSDFSPYTAEEVQKLNKAMGEWEKPVSVDDKILIDKINTAWKQKKGALPELSSRLRWQQNGNGVYTLADQYTATSGSGKNFYQHTLPALFAINHYLNGRGIRFIVVLVPDHNEIAVRALCSTINDLPSLSLPREVNALNMVGIETVSAWTEFVSAIPEGLLFCYGEDGHLESNGSRILAEKTAQKIGFEFFPKLNGTFTSVPEPSMNRTWRFPLPCPNRKLKQGEKIFAEHIYYDQKPLNLHNPQSGILVCGNSFVGYPGYQAFSSYLARALRYCPYHLERQSTGLENEIPRMLLLNNDILQNKKVCVMVIDSSRIAAPGWVDIQKLDQQLRQLDGAVLVAELPADDIAASLDSVAIPEWDKKALAQEQKEHRRKYHYFKMEAAGKTRKLKIDLPKEFDTQVSHTAEIPVWCSSLSCLKMGDTGYFFTGEDRLLIPVPAGTDHLDLEFYAAFSAARLGIGDVRIYAIDKLKR